MRLHRVQQALVGEVLGLALVPQLLECLEDSRSRPILLLRRLQRRGLWSDDKVKQRAFREGDTRASTFSHASRRWWWEEKANEYRTRRDVEGI